MKIKVGQRKVVDPELKGVVALVQVLTRPLHARQISTRVSFDEMCVRCKTPVKILLREEVDTGEILLEGLDQCPNCGNQLSNPDASFAQLSQEAIEGYFGKY